MTTDRPGEASEGISGGLSQAPGYVRPQEQSESLLVRRGLLESLVDESDCWYDHNGDCQGHGFVGMGPDERCPQAELKELLAGA